MLKFSILLALLSLPTVAATAQNSRPPCRVTGNIKGLGSKPVVFIYEQKGRQNRDTVRAVNDRFTYVAPASDDGTTMITIVGSHQYPRFWSDPGKLTVTGSMTAPGQLAVLGSPDNDLLTRYNQQMGWKFDQRMDARPDSVLALQQLMQRPTLRFIKAHPQSRTSAQLLYWQAIYDGKQIVEYEQLLRGLSASVQSSAQGQNVTRRLQAIRNQPTVGRPAPAFTMLDTADVAVSLDKFKGQYVLLDFWGHWCGPCIKAMPSLKAIQAQYARQLAVVGIGMEAPDDKQVWLTAIRKHQANWTQLSEFKGATGVIEQYNITGFPTYLLLDRQGIVLDINLDLRLIEERLKTLLPKP